MAVVPLLAIRDLTVQFRVDAGWVTAIEGVSIDIGEGDCVGVVGESGSGKSVTALSVLRLHDRAATRIPSGSIIFQGLDLLTSSDRALRRIRGSEIAMIFQDPMSSLNPVLTISEQISETLRQHQNMSEAAAQRRAVELLDLVRIPDASRRAGDYPHRLSGGMRQRVMIAMAIACRPRLLIADEPTTALDVTIQAQILALMLDLQKELGMGLILITHDLGVVAQTAQRVIVMYAGKKVEEADVETLFANPRHPYTRGLMASIPAVPSLGGNADARLVEIPGMVPSLTRLPKGCAFAPRCEFAIARCREEYPPLLSFEGDHLAACWRAAEIAGSS